MATLLLIIIYIAFISLGLPDALLGAGWPVMQTDLAVPYGFRRHSLHGSLLRDHSLERFQ